MTRTLIFTLSVVTMMLGSAAPFAQAPAPNPPAPNPPAPGSPGLIRPTPQAPEPMARWSSDKNVQVDVTITLASAPKTAPSKRMRLVAGDRQTALGRSGLEVPISTGTGGVTYRNVGLNVDARPQVQQDGKVNLMLKLNFSGVIKATAEGGGRPSFTQSSTELNLLLDSGKPLVVSQASDAEVGGDYSVEVKATVLN